ncbi:HPF/RaiA family ribosome-associated protein [Dokdonella sp.]|uniref:HPF/RaiA family ribosome-associated protein n=1 Tax=Dokdonella sp. TaxID=2291710 RepID=UPI003C664544
MKIQINTDHTIESDDRLISHVSGVIEHSLSRHASHITRVEVHLSDVNAGKSGPDDKHCAVEVRLEGRQPIAATDNASGVDAAVRGAADKAGRQMDSVLGKAR